MSSINQKDADVITSSYGVRLMVWICFILAAHYCIADSQFASYAYIEKDGQKGKTSPNETVHVGDYVEHGVKVKIGRCKEWQVFLSSEFIRNSFSQ